MYVKSKRVNYILKKNCFTFGGFFSTGCSQFVQFQRPTNPHYLREIKHFQTYKYTTATRAARTVITHLAEAHLVDQSNCFRLSSGIPIQ